MLNKLYNFVIVFAKKSSHSVLSIFHVTYHKYLKSLVGLLQIGHLNTKLAFVCVPNLIKFRNMNQNVCRKINIVDMVSVFIHYTTPMVTSVHNTHKYLR